MTGIARLGDKSTHNGTLITSASKTKVDGKLVCRFGDIHQCPIHGNTAMTTSSSAFKVEGRDVVREGDQAGCGAVLINCSGDMNVGK